MTLTIQDLGALGELIGSVAVLATLVYLAFQTRSSPVMRTGRRRSRRPEASTEPMSR